MVVQPGSTEKPASNIRVFICKFDDINVESLESLLDPLELERANAYRRDQDRACWVSARGMLRRVLALELGMPPDCLAFGVGPHGKPTLVQNERLRFNLSHSDRYAVLGLSWDVDVGVDVEATPRGAKASAIETRALTDRERRVITDLPLAKRGEALGTVWRRKEALLKALGVGLSGGMARIDSFPEQCEDPIVPLLPKSLREGRSWRIYDVGITTDESAAVAAQGVRHVLDVLRWPNHCWP